MPFKSKKKFHPQNFFFDLRPNNGKTMPSLKARHGKPQLRTAMTFIVVSHQGRRDFIHLEELYHGPISANPKMCVTGGSLVEESKILSEKVALENEQKAKVLMNCE